MTRRQHRPARDIIADGCRLRPRHGEWRTSPWYINISLVPFAGEVRRCMTRIMAFEYGHVVVEERQVDVDVVAWHEMRVRRREH